MKHVNAPFLLLTLILAACLLLNACAQPLEQRHQASGLNSHFTFKGNTAEQYIEHSQALIRQARMPNTHTDIHPDTHQPLTAITGNSPFTIPAAAHCDDNISKRSIIMTHGLTDSPYWLRSLGQFFSQQCFHVQAVLLPGHGTRPGDLTQVTWQDWQQALHANIDIMQQQTSNIYLMGFSTGATLSLLAASTDYPDIKGLFLFAPALKVHPLTVITRAHRAWSWLLPRQAWLDIQPDDDPYKYESFAMNGAAQIHALISTLNSKLEPATLTMPVFIAASAEDHTVSTSTTLALFKALPHSENSMVLYSATATDNKSSRIKTLNSHLPKQRILSSAHTALLIPPNNPHYGEQGHYAICNHYLGDDDRYQRCKNGQFDYRGEITRDNLKQGIIQRLSYNPRYQEMLEALEAFINKLQ